tara:strand:+ start:1922 stop:3061 length:1140 start_codon:yes stop_codon:yes gene_type:complete
MPPFYTIKTITNIAQALTLEQEWRLLTEANGERKDNLQCFMSWEWLSQWLHTYQTYIVELKIICIMKNDECIAIAPFYIRLDTTLGIKFKAFSLIATNEPEICEVASEFIDIAYQDQYKQKIIELLTCQLSSITNIHQFNFKELNKHSLMYAICKELQSKLTAYEEHITGHQYYINMKDADPYSASFLKKKKRTLNRFEKISTYQQAKFIIASDEIQASELFEQLITLHQQRWENKSQPGVFSSAAFYSFHKNFIRQNINKGSVVLSAIKIDDKIISVNYAIKWQNALYFYQSGIDECYKPNLSPGLLNHLFVIQYCKEQGIQEYNLLKSSKTDYKSQFSQQGDELINITMLSSNKFNWFWLALYRAKLSLKHLLKLLR